MNCRQYRPELIEMARGDIRLPARLHAEECPDCALFLEQQMVLTDLEGRLREDAVPPADLEGRIMRELRPQRRVSGRPLVWIAGGALAASLVCAAWLVRPAPKPAPVLTRFAGPARMAVAAPRPAKPAVSHRRAHPKNTQRADPPFVQIPFTEPLAPWERAEMVRIEIPVGALIAAGFPVETSDTGANASADVIVGEDGRARAVRLISISERSRNDE